MSADGFSALAVDDLGRSLMGWQLAGWQFEIPHAPLTVKFLEPGAAYAAQPEFLPIQSRTPDAETETPQGDPSHAAPQASTPVALEAYQPPSMADASDAPREQFIGSGGSASSAYPQGDGASVLPADAGNGAAPAGGGMSFSGALEVLGQVVEDIADIFEFNVIFQLNVLLDSDFVVQQITGASDASLFGLGFGQWAFTGGNAQSNAATIMDAGDYGDFGWLAGSYYETNAIYSLNALNDGDAAFNLVSGGSLSSFQDIASGGNTQSNEATIWSLTGGAGPVPEGVHIGPNDTVEYNITAQINFMNDSDIVSQQIFGAGSGSQTADTGGNSQSNTALLVDHNHAPDHAVPGNYYEYNLIYQANYMNDGDQIAQIFDAGMADPQTPETGFAADDEALPHGLFGDAIV
jgi:hypothetical protein